MAEALKPSLVEWKLPDFAVIYLQGASLETFLGGMETGQDLAQGNLHLRLETFLGGMETDALQRNAVAQESTLKPSLVEVLAEEWFVRRLETFLGGMETMRTPPGTPPSRTLKPSLVEWKRNHPTRANFSDQP